MKQQDPDDLKTPHESMDSLMRAFEQAWQQQGYDKEQENGKKNNINEASNS